MVVTDPIADMLTIVRNASSAKKQTADVKASKINEEILKILKSEGYISNYKPIKDNRQGLFRVYLKYLGAKNGPTITGLRRISKPGLRIYVRKEDIPYVLNGLGRGILSTSKGLMTDMQARRVHVGGELICYVW